MNLSAHRRLLTVILAATMAAGGLFGGISTAYAVAPTITSVTAVVPSSAPNAPFSSGGTTRETSIMFFITKSSWSGTALCSLDSTTSWILCVDQATPSGYEIYTGLGNGTHTLYVRGSDLINYSATVSFTWTVDAAAPAVSSIDRTGSSPTNAGTFSWKVVFSEAVTGVDVADFTLVRGAGLTGGSITSVTGTGISYTVNASTGTGSGTLQLNFLDNDTVRDGALNATGSAFTGSVGVYAIDKTLPSVSPVTPVPSPTTDTTPNYTFSSTEPGTIAYGGDCSSATTSAVQGNNTITFNALAVGTHSNCVLRVTDAAGNQSSALAVNTFTVAAPADATAPTVSITAPIGGSVSGTVTVAANASDDIGVAGVQFKLDGVNLGAEDTASPYAVSWN